MMRETEGSFEKLWRAEELMQEGKVDEARPLIEALEQEAELPPDALLTWQLLKSQLLFTTGDLDASQQLARQVWRGILDRGKPLQGVDASIVMAEVLVELGKFEEAAKAIAEGEQLLTTITEETPAALSQREASFFHFRGRICLHKAETDQAMDYFQQSLALRQELGNKHDIAVSLRNIGVIHTYKDDVEQALDYHQQALKLFQEVGNSYRMAWCLTNIGSFHQQKGDSDSALEYAQQGLALFQELGNKKMNAYALWVIGDIYQQKGELDQALAYFQQQRSIVEELGNKWELGVCSSAIGWLYWHRGDVDRALEYAQQALAIGQEYDNKLFIANALGVIGLIHWQKGAFAQALAHIEEDLRYHEEQGNNIQVGWRLYGLIQVSLDMDSPEQAQQYLDRLQHIIEQEDDKSLSQSYRVTQALVLKTSPRIRDKARAQELLQQLIEEEMIYFWNTQLAMINLCELLLDELKAYGEINVLHEAKSLVDKLYSLAQARHSHSLVVNSLILRAKFAMIEGDLTAAVQYLEQARVTAEEKSLGQLAEKVTTEKTNISNDDRYYLFVGTGGTEKDILAFISESNLPTPIILVSCNLNNSLPAAMEARKALELVGLGARIIHGSLDRLAILFQRLRKFVKVQEKLRKTKIGLIGVPSDWLVASQVDKQAMKEIWGNEIVSIPITELLDVKQLIMPNAPSSMGRYFLDQDQGNEISSTKITEAEAVAEKLLQLIEHFNLKVLTVECFSLVQQTEITSCLALSYLNDQGIIAGCEGDIPSAFTMLVLHLLTEQTPWMANVVDVDKKENRITLAHCTAPTKLLDNLSLTTHFETGKSVAVRGRFKIPQEVTILKIGGPNLSSWWMTKGKIIKNTTEDMMCRTQIEIVIEESVDYFLEQSLANHHCLIQGDYVEEIQQFFEFIFTQDKTT
ncbi:MAG: tetratricopeptide repeat protein [Candidatus Heimdallarchaeota archaeon]